MKKYFICGALALMSLASCSDSFLEVYPTVNISEDEYYNSEERIYSALVAAYDPLQWPDWGLGQYNPFESGCRCYVGRYLCRRFNRAR